MPLPTGVQGTARAWQESEWDIVGGNAQFTMRRDTRYTFVHTGDDDNLLTLRGAASIFGGAEADDLHYAEAGGAVVGNIAVRTVADPTPPHQTLMPPTQDGGRSEATKSPIGEVDVSLPVGDGSVDVHIPLQKTDEGELATLSESRPIDHDVRGGGAWKSVDVYLVAYIEAAADIETEFWGLSGDVNWAHVLAQYDLRWAERAVPAAPAAPDAQRPGEPGRDPRESDGREDGEPADAEALDAGERASCKNPPGKCTPDRCRDLQKEVKRLCDRKRGCEAGVTTCKVAKTYAKKNEECANARRKINDECFNGGDRGHRKAEGDARQAARNCKKIIRDKTCKD